MPTASAIARIPTPWYEPSANSSAAVCRIASRRGVPSSFAGTGVIVLDAAVALTTSPVECTLPAERSLGKNEETTRMEFETVSGLPLKAAYGPDDVPPEAAEAAAALPGSAPFMRGGHVEGYRTKAWRIFQLSGFGNPEDEAERIRYLLAKGGTGFIMEWDRMTGDHLYDVDHPEVVERREDVGLTGAVIQSARDMEIALTGIDQSKYFAHAGG